MINALISLQNCFWKTKHVSISLIVSICKVMHLDDACNWHSTAHLSAARSLSCPLESTAMLQSTQRANPSRKRSSAIFPAWNKVWVLNYEVSNFMHWSATKRKILFAFKFKASTHWMDYCSNVILVWYTWKQITT